MTEVRQDKDEAIELVGEMREHLKEADDLLDQWIDVFETSQDERGVWIFDRQKGLLEDYARLLNEHRKLLPDWNKFIPRYNATVAPQNVGRPLAASAAQVKKVKAIRPSGHGLRATAKETGLSLRTVRTILDNVAERGRDKDKAQELRRREFNRLRAAAFRARKNKADALPKEIGAMNTSAERLDKAARGLARSKT